MPNRFDTGLALVVVAGALIACKNKAKAEEQTTARGGSAAAAAPEAPRPARPERKLYDRDLRNVCDGMPEKRTTAYAKKPGEIHPLVLFSRVSESDEWTKSYSGKLGGWKAENAGDYQLVGCVTVKSSTKAKECKFDSKLPARHLDLTNATYELRVVEAHTGKELGSKTVELKAATRCPIIHTFRANRESKHPDFEPAFIDFAKSFVAPKS